MGSVVRWLRSSVLWGAIACNDVAAPPAAPIPVNLTYPGDAMVGAEGLTASAPPVTPGSAGGSADAGPDFNACSVDSDCVAVPKASCCPTGALEAVNKLSVDAYGSTVACEKWRGMCPKFRIRDVRRPLCNHESHRCEMVPP